MATANFVVSDLTNYVQNNRDLLLKNFALAGGSTRSRISIQTGIKKNALVNFLDLTPALQSGVSCEFTPSGAATLTEREINTALLKVNMDICPRHLLGKYGEWLVRNNATEHELPFEEYIMEGVTNEINKKIEKLIWQGDVTKTTDADLKWFDGFLKIAASDSAVVDVEIAGTSAYADIKAVYMAMTEETLERGGEIYVSPAIFRQFLQEMVTANYFHYASAQDQNLNEFILPGSDVKVVKTPGLAGTTNIVGTFPANLFYGCDMEGDSESIDLWYSQDDRVYKLEVLWNSGVQVAFPAHLVLGTIAED